MSRRRASGVSLRPIGQTVYNRGSMDRPGRPLGTQEQETVPGDLALPSGLERGDQALKASVKAALFQTVQEPTRIGRFTLIERVGAGAMGEVYAAYDEQLDRKVAIKLVRPDPLAGTDRAAGGSMNSQRLLREAKVLARLSHPNVVQVYEAGLFGDRVFVAMEFIRGQTLRQWLAAQARVPEPQRWRRALEMLVAAGRGLQAAHAAGLVHRDFKPDNVLVGSDDRVYVVDFGLAGMTENEPAGAAPAGTIAQPVARSGDEQAPPHRLTATGTIMGTLGYMSPEQERGASDSRSDQFSFCVTLYEALYRVSPFVARSLPEVGEMVRERAPAEPPRDTAVPARIWQVLARGLATDPAARHPSMAELLAALTRDPSQHRRRYLVAALLLTAGAMAGVVGLRASSAVAEDPCALAGSAIARLWSTEAAGRVRDAFLATNVAYAGAAWDLVRGRMDEYASALAGERRASCEATHVRREQPEDLLRLKTLCLDGRERHLEALVAELARADAGTVENSGWMVADLPRVEVCRDGDSLVLGLQPPDDAKIAAEVQEIRTRLATARVQHGAGRYAEAQRLAEAALAAADQVDYPPVRAEALHVLGIALRDGATAADVARAEQVLLNALDLAESHRHDELVNEIWLDLVALADRRHQEFAMAHQWARRAEATSRRLPAGSEQLALALGWRGSLYFREGEYQEAARWQRDALKLAKESGASRLAIADHWHHLANTLQRMARAGEAREAFEQALELGRAELGDAHPHVARLMHDFGLFLRDEGELDRARLLLAQAQAIWTATHGPRSMDAAKTQLSLVLLEIEAGDYDQAEEHARTAHEMLAAVAPESPDRARAEIRRGLVAFRKGQFEGALAAFEQGLAMQRRIGMQPQIIALNLCNIAETLTALGRVDRALSTVAEAEQMLAGATTGMALFAAMLHKTRGLALMGGGNHRVAVQELEQAWRLLEPESGNRLEKADLQWALARALAASGQEDHGRARALAESAQEIQQGRGRAGAVVSAEIARWLERQPRR